MRCSEAGPDRDRTAPTPVADDAGTDEAVLCQAATPALAALLLADGRLPTGGHAASGGLEGALTAGLRVDDITSYLRLRLRTVARMDAAVAVLASRAVSSRQAASGPHLPTPTARAGSDPDGSPCATAPGGTPAAADAVPPPPLTAADLAWAWAARTPVTSVRDASVAQGRSIVRLLRRTSPRGRAIRWLGDCPREVLARPLALGAFAGELGTTPQDLTRAVGYDEVAVVVAAALKLLPLDPADTVVWTLSCADDLACLVERCHHVQTLEEIPAPATPELDEWAIDHAEHPRRLFRV